MNRERLLNVARALRESPNPERFAMDHWALGCRTPACAAGHYAARRDLQDVFYLDARGVLCECRIGPLRLDAALTRLAIHFGVFEEDTESLFGARGCGGAQTTIEAAKYIERFVADRGGSP